jgi:hypothetical protein
MFCKPDLLLHDVVLSIRWWCRNQFYEKFMFRQYIGEILAYLWELPPHRRVSSSVGKAVLDPRTVNLLN